MKQLLGIVVLAGFTAAACAQAPRPAPDIGQSDPPTFVPVRSGGARAPDVVYVPTPEPVVEAMLELARPGPQDLVFDLGCGDGRIVITAARRYGARGVCVDIDPDRVAEARENARRAGVADRIRIVQGDLFELDLSRATVITLYLLPDLNLLLRPKLEKLPRGTRIVSHAFDMGDWVPDRRLTVAGKDVYLWVVR
ncbi:MAG: methyltransferase domain-containing protein [Burkholderiales bacterium]|nr:methyltransferase domain-containing protein [Burkholderiales bacterium]